MKTSKKPETKKLKNLKADDLLIREDITGKEMNVLLGARLRKSLSEGGCWYECIPAVSSAKR